jgi:hypothetical protein
MGEFGVIGQSAVIPSAAVPRDRSIGKGTWTDCALRWESGEFKRFPNILSVLPPFGDEGAGQYSDGES